jgi:ATP-binding cassette subfamily F protein 3
MLVNDSAVDDFPLSLDDYPKWLSEQSRQAAADSTDADINGEVVNTALSRKDRKRLEAEQRKRLQPLRKRVTQAEEKLDVLHSAQAELDRRLADPEIYSEQNKRELQDCLREKANVVKQCEAVETEWMQASEELDELSTDLPTG